VGDEWWPPQGLRISCRKGVMVERVGAFLIAREELPMP
jgi:hypothetical protein